MIQTDSFGEISPLSTNHISNGVLKERRSALNTTDVQRCHTIGSSHFFPGHKVVTFQPIKTQICHKCDILKKMSSLNSIQFHSSGCGLLPDWFSIDDSVTLSKHYKECATPLSQCCSDFGWVYDGTLESHWPGGTKIIPDILLAYESSVQ